MTATPPLPQRAPSPRRAVLRALGAALALPWLVPARRAQAQAQAAAGTDPALEYQIKGAYLFKFGEFVEWNEPAGAAGSAPLVIAVAGSPPMGEVLSEMARQRRINGREVAVRLLGSPSEPLLPAHIAFIGAAASERLRAVAGNPRFADLLTISETTDPAGPTGMINFVIQDNKVRFEVDGDAVDASVVKISSKVLALATQVRRRSR